MLQGIAEEKRPIDHRVIEGMRVRLVFQQRLAVDPEEFEAHAKTHAESSVCSGMGRTIRETDQRLMSTGPRVDSLRVLGGKPTQYFHFRSCQSIAGGVGIADSLIYALAFG